MLSQFAIFLDIKIRTDSNQKQMQYINGKIYINLKLNASDFKNKSTQADSLNVYCLWRTKLLPINYWRKWKNLSENYTISGQLEYLEKLRLSSLPCQLWRW